MPDTGEPVVRLQGVSKEFPGVLAVDDVDLELMPGEVHSVAGENGAGKSTLMKLLSQVERPSRGEIEISGEKVEFHGPRHAQSLGVAMVYQEVALAPHLSVAENLFMGHEPGRFGFVNRRSENEEARELLRPDVVWFGEMLLQGALEAASEAAARQVPDLLVQELGQDGGEIAFIPFQQGTLTNEQREKGFKQGLKDYPELKLVAEQSSQSDYNTALRVTEDILIANPGLDGIFAANEPGVLGATEAVRNAGKAGEAVIVGWDASSEEVQGVRDGVISALVVQNPFRMGYEGVNAAIRMIREGAEVESQDTGATIVTKKNLNDEEVRAVLNPSCENPPV